MITDRKTFAPSVVKDTRPLLHVLLVARGHRGVLVAVRLGGRSRTATAARQAVLGTWVAQTHFILQMQLVSKLHTLDLGQFLLHTWSPDGGVLHVSKRAALLSVTLPVPVSLSVPLAVTLPFSFSISLSVALSLPLSLPLSVSFPVPLPLSVTLAVSFALTLYGLHLVHV